MDEMGLFTTNIAINNPAANKIQDPGDKKPNPLSGSPLTSEISASGAAPPPVSGTSASGSPPASGAAPVSGGASSMGGMGMADMPGMLSQQSSSKKILSKRYGLIERPVEIWPVVLPV